MGLAVRVQNHSDSVAVAGVLLSEQRCGPEFNQTTLEAWHSVTPMSFGRRGRIVERRFLSVRPCTSRNGDSQSETADTLLRLLPSRAFRFRHVRCPSVGVSSAGQFSAGCSLEAPLLTSRAFVLPEHFPPLLQSDIQRIDHRNCGNQGVFCSDFGKCNREIAVGNYRSGRWRSHIKRRLVEDCCYIDVRYLLDHLHLLAAGRGTVPIRTHSGQTVSQPDGQTLPMKDGGYLLAFPVEFTSRSVWQGIPLLTSGKTCSRSETCFQCPANGCGGRARKLYLPPDRTHFLCRGCHNLAYRNQQQHDPRVSRLKRDPDRLSALIRAIVPNCYELSKVLLLRRAASELLDEIDSVLPDYALAELLMAGLLDDANLNRICDL